jgi:amino acid transporter
MRKARYTREQKRDISLLLLYLSIGIILSFFIVLFSAQIPHHLHTLLKSIAMSVILLPCFFLAIKYLRIYIKEEYEPHYGSSDSLILLSLVMVVVVIITPFLLIVLKLPIWAYPIPVGCLVFFVILWSRKKFKMETK